MSSHQGDSEEVESIPGPAEEADQEEEPLLSIQHPQEFERVGRLMHRRLQGSKASRKVSAGSHLLFHRRASVGRSFGTIFPTVVGHLAGFEGFNAR